MLPFVFSSDARSTTTKPYRLDFEYIDEIEMVCKYNPKVKCLWCASGVMMRGNWANYPPVLKNLVSKYPNLYISLTPEIVSGQFPGISREDVRTCSPHLFC